MARRTSTSTLRGDADAGDAEGLEEDSAEGKKKKEKPKKDANAFTSSIERNVWSHRNAIWRKYAVEMPRMKRETDDPKGADPNVADWNRKYFPASTSGFWGAKANKETFSTLDGFAKKAKPKLENCIIHGPAAARARRRASRRASRTSSRAAARSTCSARPRAARAAAARCARP